MNRAGKRIVLFALEDGYVIASFGPITPMDLPADNCPIIHSALISSSGRRQPSWWGLGSGKE